MRNADAPPPWLTIRGARHNNLKDVDAAIPLQRFVCVTGVSGSGKSSLVNDILYEQLARDLNGAETTTPGNHRAIEGKQHLDKIIAIDQSPIGRTPRSNPATYIKLFDDIRDLFASMPESKVRGYAPGRFSFNVSSTADGSTAASKRGKPPTGGRCEACEGHGANKIEMDFLADVWVTCPICEGRRFSRETLAVHYRGRSIADVLAMDVQDALKHFENIPHIVSSLQTLHDVGLDYLKLGQSSTTLSGGEAQRIKLARELVRRSTGRTLYVLDEPTTGLHFEDVRRLLAVLHGFVDAGNTVIVIEHHLDVIKTADWIIDLGPEGGAGGGRIIAEGTPEQVAECAESFTGQALRPVLGMKAVSIAARRLPPARTGSARAKPLSAGTKGGVTDVIRVLGAREHNLRDISVDIPRNAMTVCSGPSGSGKSSFAIDTVYTEGHRRYVESLSSYARQFLGQFQKPRVDHIHGLSPAIAIEQKSASRSPRSTVGTVTEIYDYMRVLWARVGTAYCPKCDIPIGTQTADEIIARVAGLPKGVRVLLCAPIERSPGEKYGALFERYRSAGYARVRVDGKVHGLEGAVPADDRRRHVVQLVVDRLAIQGTAGGRLSDSVEQCLAAGRGVLIAVVLEGDGAADGTGREIRMSQHFSCDGCHTAYQELTPNHFSFNSRLGWCESCEGLGLQRGTPVDAVVSHPKRSILDGALAGLGPVERRPMARPLIEALAAHIGFDPKEPWDKLTPEQQRQVLFGTGEAWITVRGVNGSESPGVGAAPGDDAQPDLFARQSKRAAKLASAGEPYEYRVQFRGFHPAINDATRNSWQYRLRLENLVTDVPCQSCGGGRLRRESAAVRLSGQTIHEVANRPLAQAAELFRDISLDRRQSRIAGEVLREIRARLKFLLDVGLEYLSLARGAPTLSGGEAQRIRLASQIGSGLTGVLYVLDEPTIGLHPRDNGRLITALKRLRDLGNTLLMVEHDREVIDSSDHVLDFGPGAGREGGRLVGAASPAKLRRVGESLTGRYLAGTDAIPVPTNRREPGRSTSQQTSNARKAGKAVAPSRVERTREDADESATAAAIAPAELRIVGARQHNLRGIDVVVPLHCFVCVTGVSGSGKSSLITDILSPALQQRIQRATVAAGAHDEIRGIEHLDKVIVVDQSPIGNSPMSNAATYAGVFDEMRELFARLPESKVRGYTANRFSFNRAGGRCEGCEGQGQVRHEMHFLPDVWVECEACRGQRFNRETLQVLFRGKSIADVLAMSAAEALAHFDAIPKIKRVLQTLVDVGLDYLPLGQSAPTLSGGEAQRVKLAAELGKPATGRTIYILDEPTTGLHLDDLRKLLDVLHRLVDVGNSIVCVEHNLDVIKTADWVIDLGPEAGEGGGQIVVEGPPERVAACKSSHTGRALAPMLAAGPHSERRRYEASSTAGGRLTWASQGGIELGAAGQMPWERDGRRWHTRERPSRNGEKVAWDGAVLEYAVALVESHSRGRFAATDWSDRASVEIRAAGGARSRTGGSAWFMHALTGGPWLLELRFRVPRGTFDESVLNRQLKLKTLNEREDLPIYGNEPRVAVRDVPGDMENVRVQVHDLPEVKNESFARFIARAVEAYFTTVAAPAAAATDPGEPWLKDGRGWHLSQKSLPPGKPPEWAPSTLVDLLGRLGRAAPGLKVDWANRTRVLLSTKDGEVGHVSTNIRNGLKLVLHAESGRIAASDVLAAGRDGVIRRNWPAGRDTLVVWIQTAEDARRAELQSLAATAMGGRTPAARAGSTV